MRPTPAGWQRCTSTVVYRNAAAAIDWLCEAFGFTVRIRIEGPEGRIEHSELVYGDGIIMLAQEDAYAAQQWRRMLRSPRSLNGTNTQSIQLYVDDLDAHCLRAREHGAHIWEEPAVHDYGADYWTDRSYGANDLEGHFWWITQRLRNPPASGRLRAARGIV